MSGTKMAERKWIRDMQEKGVITTCLQQWLDAISDHLWPFAIRMSNQI